MQSTAHRVKPADVFSKISAGEKVLLLDVRECSEYESVRIAGSRSLPLSQISTGKFSIETDQDVYLLCRSGQRATSAAHRLAELGIERTFVIDGGLNAWVRCGLPTEKGSNQVWSMDRQVRFTAGLLILDGIALSTINANWLFVAAVVALGMVVSAISDTCAMATVLKLLPWNRSRCK